MNQDTIALKIQVRDDGSIVIKNFREKVQQSMGGVQKAAKSASSQMLDFMKNTVKFTIGFQGVSAVLQKGKQAITDLWQASTRFDAEWQNVTTMISDSTVDLEAMRKGLLGMAGPLGGADELAKSLWLTLSSNIAPQKALYALRESAIAAKAGQADLYKVVDIGTTVLNTYGMEVERLPEVYDKMFEVNKRAKTSISELSRSMGEVIGTFASVGGTFDELNAYIVTMTLSGVKTSQTMSALKAVIANIARPTTEAAKRAEELGIQFSASALKSKGFAGFMQELTQKVQGNIEAQVDLFGSVEAFNSMAILASKQGMKRFTDALEGMGDAAGNTQKAFDKQMLAFDNVMTGLKNEVTALFITHLTPIIKSMSEWLAKNQESISKFIGNTISGIKSVLEYISPIGDVLVFIGKTVKFVLGALWDFKDEIVFAGKAFLLYFAASKIQAWGSAFLGVLGGVSGGFKGLTGNVTRFVDLVRAARSFGTSKLESIGHAAEMSGVKTGALFQKTTALKGILGNLGPVAVAAFAGWGIGKLIGEIHAVKKAAQGFFDFMTFGSLKAQEKFSQLLHMSEAQIDDAQRRENVLKLAAAHGILNAEYEKTGYNLKDVYIALGQSSTAYAQLDEASRAIVDRLTAHNTKLQEHQEQLRQVKAVTEQYRAEIYESVQVHLRLIGLPVPSWMELTRKATQQAGGAAADAKKKFEDYAASLGIVTKKGYAELQTETNRLVAAFRQYDTQVLRSSDLQEKMAGKVADLEKKYRQLGLEIPRSLREVENLTAATAEYSYELDPAIKRQEEFVGTFVDFQEVGWKSSVVMEWVTESMKRAKESAAATGDATKKMSLDFKNANEVMQFTSTFLNEIGISSDSVLGKMVDMGSGIARVASGDLTGAASVLSGFVGLLTKLGEPDWGARAEARLEGLAGVTEEMKEQLAEAAKEAGSTQKAMEEMLDVLIEMANITSHEGFQGWAEQVNMVMSQFDYIVSNIQLAQSVGLEPSIEGLMTAGSDLDDAFTALVEKAKELGYEGSASMLAIMEKAREFKQYGIEVGSVFDYIDQQYDTYGKNYEKFVEGVTGEQSFNRAIQHGQALISAMQADGKSMLEILDVIGPGLEKLMEKASAEGWQITGMSDMLGLQQFVSDNEAALGQLDLSMAMMQSLGNIGRLTADQFGLYQDELYETYLQIAEGEKHSKEALLSIAPYLQQQIWYSEQYGLSLDERTKKLIEAAKNEGLNLDAYKTQEQIQQEMNENFTLMNDNLGELVDIMGRLTGATTNYGSAWAGAAGNMYDALRAAQGFSRVDLGGGSGSIDYLLPGSSRQGGESHRAPRERTPDVFAATGYQTMIDERTRILIGDTLVEAGEKGREVLTITPVDQVKPRVDLQKIELTPVQLPARSAGSGSSAGSGKVVHIDKIEINLTVPVSVVSPHRGEPDSLENLKTKVENILDFNIDGLADKLAKKIERRLQ